MEVKGIREFSIMTQFSSETNCNRPRRNQSPAADAQRVWFSEMIQRPSAQWHHGMSFDALIELRDEMAAHFNRSESINTEPNCLRVLRSLYQSNGGDTQFSPIKIRRPNSRGNILLGSKDVILFQPKPPTRPRCKTRPTRVAGKYLTPLMADIRPENLWGHRGSKRGKSPLSSPGIPVIQ
jgi:hypothetical protein